jgi:Leucine-rich repeat (LRR) protein
MSLVQGRVQAQDAPSSETDTSWSVALGSTDVPVRLNLYGRGLTNIPIKILEIDSLVDLSLGGNPDLDLDSAFRLLAGISSLRRLEMDDCGIKEVPASVQLLSGLQQLNMSGNGLEYFPVVLCGLRDLQVLELYGNRINMIPECISELTSLQHLNMNGNGLTSLPSSLGRSHLRRLEMGLNPELSSARFFELFGQMATLDTLVLYSTGIDTLPPSVGSLTQLSYLDIGANDFHEFPKELRQLKRLKVLVVRLITYMGNEERLRKLLPRTRIYRVNR